MCEHRHGCVCHSTHMEVRGHLWVLLLVFHFFETVFHGHCICRLVVCELLGTLRPLPPILLYECWDHRCAYKWFWHYMVLRTWTQVCKLSQNNLPDYFRWKMVMVPSIIVAILQTMKKKSKIWAANQGHQEFPLEFCYMRKAIPQHPIHFNHWGQLSGTRILNTPIGGYTGASGATFSHRLSIKGKRSCFLESWTQEFCDLHQFCDPKRKTTLFCCP